MAIKGDFISFTYNGVHSTELGVMRVTSSNRYTDALLPTIQDKAVLAPGSHGTYFFGSYYTLRPITINVAFDEVSESLIRLIRKTFGDLLSHELIFDDEPYKVYYAKVTGTPLLQYIPFSSPRVYKGEGTFTFTCYEPFAHTPNSNKYLSLYTVGSPSNPIWYKYDNKTEWNLSANLLVTLGTYDNYTSATGFKVYNPGDIETDFKFITPISENFSISGILIHTNNAFESETLSVSIDVNSKKGSDEFILFNSKTNLIEGLDANGARTGNLYNDKIVGGSWFRIPLTTDGRWYFKPLSYTGSDPTLEYDYLYF